MKNLEIKLNSIELDSNAKTIDEVFNEIATLMVKSNFCKSKEDAVRLLHERESLGSTGLENGLAIPHAKGSEITQSGLIYMRFKNPIQWETFDDSNVTDIIAFAIPKDKGDEYLQVLAKISGELSVKENREKLKTLNTKTDIIKFLNTILNKEDSKVISNKKIKILGVVACPAGLAHTYMAKKAIEDAATELGYDVQVEAHGAMGIENQIFEMNENCLLIEATDIGVDLEGRFDNIYIYKTNTKEAIKNSKEIIETAVKEFNKFGKNKMIKKSKGNADFKTNTKVKFTDIKGKNKFTRALKWWGQDTLKHLMTGISYLIPLAIAASVMIGISRIISAAMGYNDMWAVFPKDEDVKNATGFLGWLMSLEYIGTKFGLATLFVPFITAFTCYSMTGKGGLAPGFLVGFICMFKEMGFIGGMVSGLITGYIILFVQKYMKVKGAWASLTPILFVPVLGTLIGGSFAWWALGYPFAQLNIALKNGLTSLVELDAGPVIIGLVFGSMIAFDLGGPVNKAAYAISAGLMGDTTLGGGMAQYGTNTAVQLSIILPPLALGLASFFGKSYYDEQIKDSGKAAFIMGLVGVSEGAIPFAIKNPIRVTILNVLGCACASMFVLGLGCIQPVNLSAFYSWGFPSQPGIYVCGILIGVLIIMLPNILLAKIQWHKKTNTKFALFSPIPSFINFGIYCQNIFKKKNDKKEYVITSAEKFITNPKNKRVSG